MQVLFCFSSLFIQHEHVAYYLCMVGNDAALLWKEHHNSSHVPGHYVHVVGTGCCNWLSKRCSFISLALHRDQQREIIQQGFSLAVGCFQASPAFPSLTHTSSSLNKAAQSTREQNGEEFALKRSSFELLPVLGHCKEPTHKRCFNVVWIVKDKPQGLENQLVTDSFS